MRNAWKTLGIASDSDRATIRRAYAARLKSTNPEDNTEGFKALREAYEWAMAVVAHREMEATSLPGSSSDTDHREAAAEPANDGDQAAAGPPPPQDEEAAFEARELSSLLRALDEQLASPHRSDPLALDRLNALLNHSGMDHLNFRNQAEFAVAHMIVERLPASDAILRRAVDVFDWERLGSAQGWPFVAVLARYDEWKLIASLERPGHKLHTAWKRISEKRSKILRSIDAFGPLSRKIGELLDIIDYQAPGLIYSTRSEEVEWWRRRLERSTVDFRHYGLVFVAALALATMLALARNSFVLGASVGALFFLALAIDRYGRDGGYQRLAASRWHAKSLLALLAGSWPWLFAAVPLAALLVPPAWWGCLPVLVLSIAAVLGLRLSHHARPAQFGEYWGAAIIGALVIIVVPTLLLAPPPSRIIALAAVTLLATQPAASSRAFYIVRLESIAGGYGSLIGLVYAGALAAAGYLLSTQHLLSDPVTAASVVGMTLWALVPIIGSALNRVIAFLARLVRAAAMVILLTAVGQGDFGGSGQGMSNGEALVTMSLSADSQLPKGFTQTLDQMRRENPKFHRRIEELAAPAVRSGANVGAMRAAAQLIDEAIGREVTALLPNTSDELAGRYQDVKVSILRDLLATDVRSCAAGSLQAGAASEATLRLANETFLAIVARGAVRSAPARLQDVPSRAALNSAAEELRGWSGDALKVQADPKLSKEQISRCRDKLAEAWALAQQPDRSIAAVLSLNRVRP